MPWANKIAHAEAYILAIGGLYENTISLTELLKCGILCPVMSSLQNLQTVSRIDLITSGKIRRLFTIFVLRFTEPNRSEVTVDSFR